MNIHFNILRTLFEKFEFDFNLLIIESNFEFVSLFAVINVWLSSEISAPRSNIQYFIIKSFWSSASAEIERLNLEYHFTRYSQAYQVAFLIKKGKEFSIPSRTLKCSSRIQFPWPLVVPFQYLHNLFGQSEGHSWSQNICMIHPKLFPTLSPS